MKIRDTSRLIGLLDIILMKVGSILIIRIVQGIRGIFILVRLRVIHLIMKELINKYSNVWLIKHKFIRPFRKNNMKNVRNLKTLEIQSQDKNSSNQKLTNNIKVGEINLTRLVKICLWTINLLKKK